VPEAAQGGDKPTDGVWPARDFAPPSGSTADSMRKGQIADFRSPCSAGNPQFRTIRWSGFTVRTRTWPRPASKRRRRGWCPLLLRLARYPWSDPRPARSGCRRRRPARTRPGPPPASTASVCPVRSVDRSPHGGRPGCQEITGRSRVSDVAWCWGQRILSCIRWIWRERGPGGESCGVAEMPSLTKSDA
jgi:hypothetical protein